MAAARRWTDKAKAAAASLKAQHAAGLEGDDAPTEPIWPTPKQQLDAVKRLFRATRPAARSSIEQPRALPEVAGGDAEDRDAADLAEALRGVDWDAVRATTAGKAGDVSRAIRAMSQRVDWAKVQPVAAQVSSALIAAVAAGRLPVGGRLGPIVARAITDQNQLGDRVARTMQQSNAAPPDFRSVIETTAREA
jgi:hypothetical protein